MDNSDLFWNASLEDLKNGFVEENGRFLCLLCGIEIEKGVVYQDDGVFYEAGRYMRVHIEKNHGSVFDCLIELDKRYTGLTEHQNLLLRIFHQGKSDEEARKEIGVGSTATIRNHRFVLREKERQAKIFLTLMELLREKDNHAPAFLNFHRSASMVDDRYNITQDEKEEILKKYFPNGLNGPLKSFSVKEKHKLVILQEIARRFESGRTYTEREINDILKPSYDDYCVLRRYLIEYRFMERKPDGSQYWLKG